MGGVFVWQGKRASAVVYRLDEGLIKYLLVTQKPESSQCILPQGRRASGETLQQTAYRETLEEYRAIRLKSRKWFESNP